MIINFNNTYRPGDPPDYNSLYAIPAVGFLGAYGWATLNGLAEIHQAAYLAASLCCVGALAGLSSQATSRLGNNLGMVYCSDYIYNIPNTVIYIFLDWSCWRHSSNFRSNSTI